MQEVTDLKRWSKAGVSNYTDKQMKEVMLTHNHRRQQIHRFTDSKKRRN